MGKFNNMELTALERFKHIGYAIRASDGTEELTILSSDESVNDWLYVAFPVLHKAAEKAYRVPCGTYDELWIIAPGTTLIPPK